MFVKSDCIHIGKIVRTHGIHGHLVLVSNVNLTEKQGKEAILLDIDGGLVPFFVRKENGIKERDHQSYFLHFDHIENKEMADKYVGLDVYLTSYESPQEVKELPPESVLKGYKIYNQSKEYIGEVQDIIDYSGNVLLSVISNEDEYLIPFTEDHIISWDTEKRSITITISEGLLEI